MRYLDCGLFPNVILLEHSTSHIRILILLFLYSRDAFLVPFINCFTSFYAGFVIFSVLGFMAHAKGVPVDKVADGGKNYIFLMRVHSISGKKTSQK